MNINDKVDFLIEQAAEPPEAAQSDLSRSLAEMRFRHLGADDDDPVASARWAG